MSKELFISSSPHETKVAVLEDDELVEVYFERDIGSGLAGSIYKGRVSRVLPGMQSAFVDIGLGRDAFLYVSDFFEDSEEYDKVVSEAEARVAREVSMAPRGAPSVITAPPSQPEASVGESTTPASAVGTAGDAGPAPVFEAEKSAQVSEQTQAAVPPAQDTPNPTVPEPVKTAGTQSPAPPVAARRSEAADYRGRGQRGRRRRRGGRGFGEREHRFPPKPEAREHHYEQPHEFEILPGESLAKYSRASQETSSAAGSEPGSSADEASVAPPEKPQETGMEAGFSPVGQLADREEGATPDVAYGAREARADEFAPKPHDSVDASIGDQFSPLNESSASEAVVEFSSVEGDAGPSEVELEKFEMAAEPSAVDPSPLETGVGAAYTEPVVGSVTESGTAEPSSERVISFPLSAEPSDSFADSPEGGGAPGEFDQDAVSEASHEYSDPSPAQASPLEETAGVGSTGPEAPVSQAPAQAEDRSYTLREPQRRPRFAPRRGRRGRRGAGGYRERGGPRHGQEVPRSAGNNQPVQISELLKEGQEILVQIAKEPLGTKGARITSHVALPGRYLVYMPTIHHIGVSRKIASEDERLRLRNIILEHRGSLTGGFIVRTAGQGRSEEEFRADLKFLTTLWNEIRTKFERARAPALLHRDLDLTQRILRDILSPDFKSVRVDNEVEYERILDFVSRCQPGLLGHVRLYEGDAPMFEEFGIQAEIDKALKPKVWLKSGGFIVINQTEALVAIDVNTGKYVGKTNRLEDTIVRTNIDAIREIVRQIRLRDLGGIIVIDFIDMDERRNRQKVVQALEEALRHDRAPTNILSINEFGLVALTRKRVKQSLERTLCEPCHYCSGSGWTKSVTTVCYEILSEARKMAREIEGKVLSLRVNPEVARALKSREGVLLSELESLTRKDILIKSDPTIHVERFEIY